MALDDTRVERVLALAHDDLPPYYVLEALGEVPGSRGGQRAWCGLAAEIERYRDRHGLSNEFMALEPESPPGLHPVQSKAWARVHDLVENADGIIEVAHQLDPETGYRTSAADSSTWEQAIERSLRHIEATRAAEVSELSHEVEVGHDLDLGW